MMIPKHCRPIFEAWSAALRAEAIDPVVERFDMGTWGRVEPCGTVACAAGVGLLRGAFPGFLPYWEGHRLWPYFGDSLPLSPHDRGHGSWAKMAGQLDIPFGLWVEVTVAIGCDTPSQVADLIDAILAE